MTISTAFPRSTRATTGLIALLLTATAGAAAQTAADSALRTGTLSDSARAPALPGTGGDSSAGASRAGQVPGAASSPTAVGGDSAAAAAAPAPAGVPNAGIQPPSGAASTIVTPVAPVDTTLARACAGAPTGSVAPGLLTVVFRPGTPDKQRAAAARAVGGTLGGPTEYGEEYVRVPSEAGPLALVADRLIRQEPVTRVSPAPCPAPMPAVVSPATAPGAPGAPVANGGGAGAVPGTPPGAAPGTAPGAAPNAAPGASGDTTHAPPAASP